MRRLVRLCPPGTHPITAGMPGLVMALLLGLWFITPAAVWSADQTGALESPRIREMPIPNPDELGPAQPAEHPGPFPSPPDDPQVGDEWYWWLFYHVGMPHFEQRLCTVRGKTDHAYVVVENSVWNVGINQADVDHILHRWENESIGPYPDMGIYDLNRIHFGEPPDELDNDPRIYIMWFDFGNDSDGFFFYFDEEPNGTYSGLPSNECEVVYLNTDNGQSPSGDYMLSVVAHEFEHMIHWKYDTDELPWVNEGMAELAMWFYGRPDDVYAFNANPDNNLTYWPASGGGTWADYIKTYLWTLYFYERFGAGPIYDVVHAPANSFLGYDAVLDTIGSENFADVFADWTVANYLDDPTIGDGRWGYVGEDLPPFSDVDHSSYPVGPIAATVQYWAADYVNFLMASDLTINFDGADGTSFAVWALEIDPAEPTRVTRVTLDGAQNGSINLPDVGGLYERAVMVVAHNLYYGPTNYTYEAFSGLIDVASSEPAAGLQPQLQAPLPNPFISTVSVQYDLPRAVTAARLKVLDPAGRLVRTLVSGPLPAGPSSVTWDGRNDQAGVVASGIYYFRLVTDENVQTTRAVLLR